MRRQVPFGAEEATMKELKCRDAGFDCDAVVRGESVDAVMAQAGPHAKEVHGVDVTPEMAGQLRTLVRDA
jgi:predicted small metal-binding protein